MGDREFLASYEKGERAVEKRGGTPPTKKKTPILLQVYLLCNLKSWFSWLFEFWILRLLWDHSRTFRLSSNTHMLTIIKIVNISYFGVDGCSVLCGIAYTWLDQFRAFIQLIVDACNIETVSFPYFSNFLGFFQNWSASKGTLRRNQTENEVSWRKTQKKNFRIVGLSSPLKSPNTKK